MSISYTPEEQQQFLEDAAIARGYKSWAEYEAAELDYSVPVYDEWTHISRLPAAFTFSVL